MSAADLAQTAVDERGEPRSGDDLSGLLAAVAAEGWGGDAGRRAVGIMRSACRREAMHWIRTAGWLTDEGLSEVWEQMDRLVRAGRFADAPGLLRVAVRRAYAAEAAAAQTGLGSASTRGLIGAVRRADVHSISALDGEAHAVEAGESGRPAAPAWMRTLAAVLAMEGWAWPVPPLNAVMAAAAGAASTSRRCRSTMAAHRTGVPAATWSALDLLTLGSGPGCRPEARAIGVSMQFDVLGAAGVRSNRELMRVVRAAVEGRPVRTGRKRAA
jgi:Arc/MetJ-type ribon-helix-helix transcriptional regulator